MGSRTRIFPKLSRKTGLKTAGLLLLMWSVTGANCIAGEEIAELFGQSTEAVNVLEDAVDALESNSADWRNILESTIDELEGDVRTDVTNILQRASAAASVEVRCNIDFLGYRAKDALERLIAEVKGESAPPLVPIVCSTVPPGSVARAFVPDNIPAVEYYGYNFDVENIEAFHDRGPSGRIDVTEKLSQPTHYALTLPFGPTGIVLDDRSERLTLEWEGGILSQLPVVQPSPPPCDFKILDLPEKSYTYMPPHTRGDRDFHGHGPYVQLFVQLQDDGNIIRVRIQMHAKETESDWTTATGEDHFEIHRVHASDPDYRLWRYLTPTLESHDYTDGDHTNDEYNLGGGLIKRLVYVGDTDGDEAGTKTQVTVRFNRISVELKRVSNCSG